MSQESVDSRKEEVSINRKGTPDGGWSPEKPQSRLTLGWLRVQPHGGGPRDKTAKRGTERVWGLSSLRSLCSTWEEMFSTVLDV